MIVADNDPFVKSSNSFVFIGGLPVFWWPTFSTSLERPTFYLSDFKAGRDDNFGTQVTSGGMTKMLYALMDAGFIERIENPADGRSRLVRLTAEGAKMAEQIVEELIETNKALIGGILTGGEAEQLATLLAKLSKGLHDRKANGAGD